MRYSVDILAPKISPIGDFERRDIVMMVLAGCRCSGVRRFSPDRFSGLTKVNSQRLGGVTAAHRQG
jgi:hypothetical protein